MSLCEACRKALPNIPASGGNEDSIAATYKRLLEHGHWYRKTDWRGDEKWYLRDPFLLHASWESLVLSLGDDCPICWTLWRNIRSSPISSPNDESMSEFKAQITEIDNDPEWHQYWVSMRLTAHQRETKELRFNVHKTTERNYLEAERECPLTVQHTPQSAAHVASRWIEACETHHLHCLKQAAPPENARMPCRLLDLGDANSKVWRLYQDPGHVPYAALSHRWSSETPELHTGNYENYCTFQPDSILPQNYQDIISICRAIPIRYLWIDSLCIIQNDNGYEFSKEAPLMRDIYQYAFLTLSICWDFPGVSIFRNCRPRSIPRPKPDGHCGKDLSLSELNEWVFAKEMRHKELRVHVSGAPINQRAWVLQERCLSRRLLYLGNDQLYWECDGCTGSEASPRYLSNEGGRNSVLDLTGGLRGHAWRLTLAQYTRSDLTFESDRLIALAGLAKSVASKSGDTYFGGIWLEYWMQDLLWEPQEEISRSSKLKPKERTIVPPSWSWLGFPGSLKPGIISSGDPPRISTTDPNSFESNEYQPLALLSQAVFIPPTSDPFSFFERAILKFRCFLLPVTFTGIPHEDEQSWYFRHEYNVDLCSVGLDHLRLQACKFKGTDIAFRFCFSKPLNMSLQYFLLPLCLHQSLKYYPRLMHGLLLQRGLREGTEEYTRVGSWSEDHRYLSQLSPMISNTIIKLEIGKNSTLSDGCLTENERVFEKKFGEYAAGHVNSKVLFPMMVVKRVVEHQSDANELDEKDGVSASEGTEQEAIEIKEQEEEGPFVRNEEVECSLLPHFTTAEWGTICLV